MSPAKRSDWPLWAQLADRFGFPTLWACIVVYCVYAAVSWTANNVVLPGMQSVIKTHESIRESVSEQARISSEMVNLQKQNTAILTEIKDGLADGRR